MASNLTRQDHHILEVLGWHLARTASGIAALASLERHASSATAARHLAKLTELGLAEQTGTRLFPAWVITDRGRAALAEESKSDAHQ
jgi:DNA-binding IclR family transcriptional regulator